MPQKTRQRTTFHQGLGESGQIWLGLRTAIIITAVFLFLITPCQAFYEDADVRAIRFNGKKAAEMGNPVVLIAHQSEISMSGNGPRESMEHLFWYINDPNSPLCDEIRGPKIKIDASLEIFELKHCLIYRRGETITVPPSLWHLEIPPNWPDNELDPWRIATAEIPPLEAGDILEIAYNIGNPWRRIYYPSDWEVKALTNPYAPTIERNIKFKLNPALEGAIRILGDSSRPLRHRGGLPMWEVLTGNLPVGPANPFSLVAPRVYFTSDFDWEGITTSVGHNFRYGVLHGSEVVADLGSKIASSHRESRDRLESIYKHIGDNYKRINEPLLNSNYYPRTFEAIQEAGTTKPLDRAMLFGALASAASIQVDLFLARSNPMGFMPDFHSPMQFDQMLLRLYLIDENQHLFIDPWADNLQAGLDAIRAGSILLGASKEWSGLFSLDEDLQIKPID